MRYSYRLLALSGAAAFVAAQTPEGMTPCDYYTGALLTDNTAANQLTVLTLLVNTAVIGSYERPEIPGVTFPDVEVDGILNPEGMYEGTPVNLVPYFDGTFNSTNRGGDMGESVNFLDGGGAEPLMNNMPGNDPSTNQYMLLTSLYSYFGTLLGCSQVGTDEFPAYSGSSSQASVHQFMALDTAEVSYFITQVGMSAARFGVADQDVQMVGETLNGVFNVRCAAPSQPIPDQMEDLNSICLAEDCTQAEGGDCAAYPEVLEPVAVSSMSGGDMSSTMMSSSAMSSSTPTGTESEMPSATDMGGAEPSEGAGAGVRSGVGMAMGAVAAAAAIVL